MYTVKSRFNEWLPSALIHSLNRDFTLIRDFLMRYFILVTRFRSLNRDFMLNRDSLNRDFIVYGYEMDDDIKKFFVSAEYFEQCWEMNSHQSCSITADRPNNNSGTALSFAAD